MASRMLTLFGDELIPEHIQGAPKKAAKRSHNEPDQTGPDKGGSTGILAGWTPEKQYYTIGEVAALFNVRTSHIRYWTIEFELKVRTTRKGDRLYTPANIDELRTIYHLLKERGFTIPGAKAMLGADQKKTMDTLDLKQALLQLRNQLLTIRNELL